MRKLVAKVLIVGNNPALLAGFLRRVSGENLSYQLYSSMGIGLGVAKQIVAKNVEVVTQLWSLPIGERVSGINASLSLGTKGLIVLVDDSDIPEIEALLSSIDPMSLKYFNMVVTSENGPNIEHLSEIVKQWNFSIGQTRKNDSIDAIMTRIANSILGSTERVADMDISVLPEASIEAFEPQPRIGPLPLCSEDEIDHLHEFAQARGFSVTQQRSSISLEYGQLFIDLATAEVTLEPKTCSVCRRNCKRKTRICLIGMDKGWSSENLGERALLIMAMLQAFSTGHLPSDVRNQMRYASNCKSFQAKEGIQQTSLLGAKAEDGETQVGISLLKEAKKRLQAKKLSSNAYTILRDWFCKFHNYQE